MREVHRTKKSQTPEVSTQGHIALNNSIVSWGEDTWVLQLPEDGLGHLSNVAFTMYSAHHLWGMRDGTFQSGAPETTYAFESYPGKLHGVQSNFDWNLMLLSLPKLKRNRLVRTRHIASSNKKKSYTLYTTQSQANKIGGYK